jgi:hypothetical protein
MNITYETTADLNPDALYSVVKEYIEKATGKSITNIYFSESDAGTSAKVVFSKEVEKRVDAIQVIIQGPIGYYPPTSQYF